MPSLTPSLLAVSKQISEEAKKVIHENRFIVDGLVAKGPRHMIHSKILPDHVLPHLTSLTIVLNLIRPGGNPTGEVLSAPTGNWR